MSKFTEFTIKAEDNAIRLDRWFKRHIPALSQAKLQKHLRKKDIRVDSLKAEANQRVETGQKISVLSVLLDTKSTKPQKHRPFDALPDSEKSQYIESFIKSILYEDESIIVINKPPGLAVQGGNKVRQSVDDLVRFYATDYEPKLVHRLDKDTSGLLIIAKNASVASAFATAFKDKTITKHYWALVRGYPPKQQGTIKSDLSKEGFKMASKTIEKQKEMSDGEGKTSISHYKVIAKKDKIAWVELEPVTGRTHQLRVHMQSLGTPIIGDGKYGGHGAFLRDFPKQLHLHAQEIILPKNLPVKRHNFTAPLPKALEKSWKFFK